MAERNAEQLLNAEFDPEGVGVDNGAYFGMPFTPEEAASHPTPAEAVAAARNRMGEGGYHILYNNCEHFANECVTGKHYSEQVEGVREMFKGLLGKKND